MAAFRIEKGVPVPAVRYRKAGYPFAEMAVGDSFIIHCADAVDQRRLMNRVRTATVYYRKAHDKAAYFTVMAVEEQRGKLAVRCWRIEKEQD